MIEVRDGTGTWGVNALTMLRNSKTIMSIADDLIANVRGLVFSMEYNGTTWSLQ